MTPSDDRTPEGSGPPPPPTTTDTSRARPSITRITVGAVLLLIGVMWLFDATGLIELRWRAVFAAALTVIGVSLLATARREPHGGVIATGVVLGVLLLASAATPLTVVTGAVGERQERPVTLAETGADYELGVGSLVVDLRQVEEFPAGARISASVGIGEVVVRLPDDVGAEVQMGVGIGEATVLGESQGGFGVSVSDEIEGAPTVVLELSAGIGHVEVRR